MKFLRTLVKYKPIVVAESQPVETFELVITQSVVILVDFCLSNLPPILRIRSWLVLSHDNYIRQK